MAEIRNTITLDNQMSKVLEIVKQDMLKTIEVFGGFDAVLEMATKNFEIIKKHSAGLTDAVEKFEAHIESTGSSLGELMDKAA